MLIFRVEELQAKRKQPIERKVLECVETVGSCCSEAPKEWGQGLKILTFWARSLGSNQSLLGTPDA